MSETAQSHARQIFRAALAAADAAAAVRRNLQWQGDALQVGATRFPLEPSSRISVVGAGKASARMAQTVEDILGARIHHGFISVKDGHGAPTRYTTIHEAGHPLPDERSLANGRHILTQVHGLAPHDLALCLISGGGSALMELLGEGLTLDHLRTITRAVMLGGANIVELNCVRKHLSRLKGGQLARAAQPARLCALILSDVVGDDLSAIASGPTCPDATTFADALDVVRRYAWRGNPSDDAPLAPLIHYLERGERGELPDTPKPDDPLFLQVYNLVIGNNRMAVEAAAQQARALGYQTEIITTFMQGEAREAGKLLAAIARERVTQGARKLCLLAGGETTVSVSGKGKGGRNQELALAAAIALEGLAGVTLLSAATDGGDGSSDAAGALVDADTLARARAKDLRAQRMLDDNDSHSFFAALGAQVVTGPTFTNVNDVVVMVVE